MNFIVCSYGGSGSWLLVNYLKNFGNSFHIHQRYPPEKLTYPDPIREKFSKREVEQDKINTFKVIFIYKNPIRAIYSRFDSIYHLKNIESRELRYNAIFNTQNDVFGIEEYYNNYMRKGGRNYDIYCVKYEDFFQKLDEFHATLGLSCSGIKPPIKQETSRPQKHYAHLLKIYGSLIEDMSKRKFIEIS